MSILHIVKYPDELLHEKSKDIKYFDKKLENLVSNMFETMYKFDGIGLAAVQIGILKNVIVIDIDKDKQQFKSEVINPKIISFSQDTSEMNEGCLSVKKKTFSIKRPNKIIVEFFKLDGKQYKIEADGLLSKCFQHEIDHTNGITIVDRYNEQKD
jgi:peptide deformylase